MRRSTSCSNIPLPTFRRQASNENLANPRSSQSNKPNLRRSNSSNNLLTVPKRSYSRHDLATNVGQSACKSASKRFTATPVRPAASASKRFTATPVMPVASACSSSSKFGTPYSTSKIPQSPMMMLKVDLINDKRYSSEQYRKICSFMQLNDEEFDPKSLKPISLASFVHTTAMLFSKIDCRIKIDMGNYKEVVFKYLKLYKYPGPVSMSLLKTVNTSVSWTQVMSIFGWLVDLVSELTAPAQKDLVEEYILCKARSAFQGESQTKGLFKELLEKELQFDEEDYEELKGQVEPLKQEAENWKTLIDEKENTKKMLSENYEKMKLEIKEFKEDNLEEKIKNELSDLRTELESIGNQIDEIKTSNEKLQQTISNQKYSLQEKKEIVQKLENEKYSLSLKKEEVEGILQLVYENDHELTNTRRQIESEVYEINKRLVQLNLDKFIDDTSTIRLPDRGIHKSNFSEELEEKKVLLDNVQKNIRSNVEKAQNELSSKKMQLEELLDDIKKYCDEIDVTKEEKSKILAEISRLLYELDIMEKQNQNKLKKLLQEAPDLESLEKKKSDLQKEVLSLQEKEERLNEEFVEIFLQLKEETEKEAQLIRSYMNRRTDQKYNEYLAQKEFTEGIIKKLKEHLK